MSKQRTYLAWNGEAMTYDALHGELGSYMAHMLIQCTPYEFVDDSLQEAFLLLWEELLHDPKWIARRKFTSKAGLARRLAYDGRQQHRAWGPVQRLYEQRVANVSSLDDWLGDGDLEQDFEVSIDYYPRTGHTDFWRDLSEMEPRNLDVILYPDGCHHDWCGLADIRMDLLASIEHVFRQMRKDQHERTVWAILSLVYGITVEQAAYMAGVTRPAMNKHMIRCRKLMREKLLSYASEERTAGVERAGMHKRVCSFLFPVQ